MENFAHAGSLEEASVAVFAVVWCLVPVILLAALAALGFAVLQGSVGLLVDLG